MEEEIKNLKEAVITLAECIDQLEIRIFPIEKRSQEWRTRTTLIKEILNKNV